MHEPKETKQYIKGQHIQVEHKGHKEEGVVHSHVGETLIYTPKGSKEEKTAPKGAKVTHL